MGYDALADRLASDLAAVATRAGETVVENLAVDEPRRRTGAGDRFSAALGNCCAAHYVETSETADRDELRSVLEPGPVTSSVPVDSPAQARTVSGVC